ncbi:SMI1/KNR4 family protein [Trinickia fusca]|uniref:SMI1/KNR4 family protein n=1 Tax=Trinickia fusca TaxID=2419777 RepID=A0A494X4Z8_9BURK|nr:SMI1/KNR4 family protein [Trinickia fusca]RKP43276.1 SMI1/KNR4 family protein [Trinickia fusca]
MERYLFNEEQLPNGFLFPCSFLEFVARDPIPDLEPWWFFCKFKDHADAWINALRRLYPNRHLIPFAKMQDSDDVACFDASGPSVDPRVYYVHAYASPGWEDRGSVTNFTEWLRAAEEESRRYKSENHDDI